jgi:hypothetical protein
VDGSKLAGTRRRHHLPLPPGLPAAR